MNTGIIIILCVIVLAVVALGIWLNISLQKENYEVYIKELRNKLDAINEALKSGQSNEFIRSYFFKWEDEYDCEQRKKNNK